MPWDRPSFIAMPRDLSEQAADDLAVAYETAKARRLAPRFLGAGINLDSEANLDRELYAPVRKQYGIPEPRPTPFQQPRLFQTGDAIVAVDPTTGQSKVVHQEAPRPHYKTSAQMEAENAADKVLLSEDADAEKKVLSGMPLEQVLSNHPLLLERDPFRKKWLAHLKAYQAEAKTRSPGEVQKQFGSLIRDWKAAKDADIPIPSSFTNRMNDLNGMFRPSENVLPPSTNLDTKVRRYNPATRRIE